MWNWLKNSRQLVTFSLSSIEQVRAVMTLEEFSRGTLSHLTQFELGWNAHTARLSNLCRRHLYTIFNAVFLFCRKWFACDTKFKFSLRRGSAVDG